MKNLSPLAAFCQRHKISRTKLSEIAGGDVNQASRQTMQRLLHDQITDADYKVRLRKILAQNLPAYLISLGYSATEIDRQLQQIFDKGEYQPMSIPRTNLPKDVQKFFGLSEDPFKFPPRDNQEVFISPAIKAVVDRVIDAIKFQGIVCVIGDIGSGKTTVRQIIEDRFAEDEKIRLVFPDTENMERVTPANISRSILQEFNIDHIPNDAVWRSKKVTKILASAYKDDGIKTAVIIDEGHRLNSDTLSSMKNFHEMKSGGFQRYLSIILFGQPSLMTRLKSGDKKRDFREIYERITEIPMLESDFRESAADYLAKRLSIVGGDIADLFDSDALEFLSLHAKTPLQFGNLVNTALLHSKNDFNNRNVIGAAIRTKMKFSSNEPKGKGAR